jgi:hypothetical protein
MAIIVVGGSNRGVGKTALICGLIAALPEFRWTAVKITSDDHGQPKPIWEETTAGQETDTARYLAAGAVRALLATPPLHGHPPAPDLPPMLNELWPKCGRGTNLLFESNSIVHYVRPDLCLLIHASPGQGLAPVRRIPSFTAAVLHADAMVTHSSADGVIPEGLCLPGPEPSSDQGPEPKPIFHLASLKHISPEMQAWLCLKLRLTPRS